MEGHVTVYCESSSVRNIALQMKMTMICALNQLLHLAYQIPYSDVPVVTLRYVGCVLVHVDTFSARSCEKLPRTMPNMMFMPSAEMIT